MCTILFLYRTHPDIPLIVAANRDEVLARPAEGPQRLHEDPVAVGGVDLESGGTWMGVNADGMIVGLTNQRTHRPYDPVKKTRGDVVRTALQHREPESLCDWLQGLRADDYNPFNLLFGNASRLYAAYARNGGAGIEVEPAPEGVHVLPNDRIGAPGFPRAVRARELAEPVARRPWPELACKLAGILADHEAPVCEHGAHFGTRSATIAGLVAGGVAHYLFADGPPCTAAFEDHTALMGGRAR